MEQDLRNELEVLAKPSNMKIATLMKAILWTHINNQKKKVVPQQAEPTGKMWSPKTNLPPKEIVVTDTPGRKIIKNEFVDE